MKLVSLMTGPMVNVIIVFNPLGTYIWADGNKYVGDYFDKNDNMHYKGVYTFSNDQAKYEGEFKNKKFDGNGTLW
jgi:hypothetical protein